MAHDLFRGLPILIHPAVNVAALQMSPSNYMTKILPPTLIKLICLKVFNVFLTIIFFDHWDPVVSLSSIIVVDDDDDHDDKVLVTFF